MTSTGVAAGFFQGTLDEVRIWNVARSAADIQATMGGPLTTPRAQPDRPMGAQRRHRHDDGRQLGPRQPRHAHERTDLGGRLARSCHTPLPAG